MFRRKIKRGGKFISIKRKMIYSLSIVSILTTICAAAYSYSLASSQVMDISMRLSTSQISAAGETLDTMFNSLEKRTDTLVLHDSLHSLAYMDELSEQETDACESSFQPVIADILNEVKNSNCYDFVGIYLKNGYVYESGHQTQMLFDSFQACTDYYSARGRFSVEDTYVSGGWYGGLTNQKNENILSYVRFIYRRQTLEKVGIIVFGLHESRVEDYLNLYTSDCFLIASNGEMLTGTNSCAAGKRYPETDTIFGAMRKSSQNIGSTYYQDENGDKRVIAYCALTRMGTYLIAPFAYYEDILNREMFGYIRSVLLMIGLEIIVILLASISISNGLTGSVYRLVDFTKRIGSGDNRCRYTQYSNDEIALLGSKINEMLDNIQRVNQEKERELLEKQEIKIQLLQQQINPHLLYNTLDTLLWTLQQGYYEKAQEIVASLGEFFKATLSQGREMITMAEELKLVGHFLDLQRLARGKMFHLTLDVPEALMQLPINKLSIQPLVENAVLHGFDGYRADGSITIRASSDSGTVTIVVEDNGIGMLDEEVMEINSALQQFPKPEAFHHFGLYNIHRRIVQKYGESFGLTVYSEIGSYTKVIMTLPAQHSPDSEGCCN